MRSLLLLPPALALIAACALNAAVGPAPVSSRPAGPDDCVADPRGSAAPYRNHRNRLYKRLGEPRFRGVDLIASEADENQTLGGKIAYTAADKDVAGESVHVFACVGGSWRWLREAVTDRDGRFGVMLTGDARLPPGLRDLFAYVPGHGGGVRFVALVLRQGEEAVVSDVDGTLTESENAILSTVLFGDDIAPQPHAPRSLAATGRPVIYLTARGDQLTEVTRRWLAVHGFPRGPLRLAPTAIVRPGRRTVAFKTSTLRALRVPVAAGIGNRASDVAAYRAAGLPPSRILINLPEFTEEVQPHLAAGAALAFDDYREVPALLAR